MARASLFAALPDDLANVLFDGARSVSLAADQTLFLAGDAGNGCYRVEQGLLKVSMVSRSGTERILAILGPGAIVGELAIIDGRPRSASVVALKDAELTFVSKATFDDFAARHHEVYKYLVGVLSARIRDIDAAMAAVSFLPLKGRLATTMLELAEHFGHDVGSGGILIRQKFGQADFAAMAGIARENVSRILNDWKRRKLVSRISGYYCLEDQAKLKAEIDH
jgi:CRP/FNR family transcriptional regulator, cyclic AMP receptor protein